MYAQKVGILKNLYDNIIFNEYEFNINFLWALTKVLNK